VSRSSPPADQPRIGALIRARRIQLRLTLQDLSDAAGVSVGHLSTIERDQATPSLGMSAWPISSPSPIRITG
jgi:DNA-binding XRE family transcriptional regulator